MLFRSELRLLAINASRRRLLRLLLDPAFWWSVLFGGVTVTGSVWYAGMQIPWVLAGAGAAWALVAVSLNYELTLLQPTTRCRRCHYQLLSHLDPANPAQKVVCPECGAKRVQTEACGARA